jgi:hypothetical protein
MKDELNQWFTERVRVSPSAPNNENQDFLGGLFFRLKPLLSELFKGYPIISSYHNNSIKPLKLTPASI